MSSHRSSHSHILPRVIKRKPFENSPSSSSTFTTISNITNTHPKAPITAASSGPATTTTNPMTADAKTPSTTPRAHKRPKTPNHDRFIPNRSAMDIDVSRHALASSADGKENGALSVSNHHHNHNNNSRCPSHHAMNDQVHSGESPYSSIITASLLDQQSSSASALGSSACSASAGGSSLLHNDLSHSKILSFSDKAPAQKEGYLNASRVLFSQGGVGGLSGAARRHKFRHIPTKPDKILDAPNLLEDYYLNLVDWGSNNILAVALAESVYLWHADTGAIDQLCEVDGFDDCVTSVSFIQGGQYLAVGTNSNDVQIWDVARMRQLRTMRSHSARVGALAWNQHLLSSGARDGSIHHHDVRQPRHHVSSLVGHTQEVCGLTWNGNGTQLASGSNDNTVCVWDHQQHHNHASDANTSGPNIVKPKHTLTAHTAAVKALAWCPWQSNLLATGGGTADRFLRFWNTTSGTCVNAIDTKSQVCSVVWNPHDKELLTSHGFSQNQLTVWKYPSLARMAELKGHTSRVLHTAISPDGHTVVSGAADETLRFWKVFADSSSGKTRRDVGDKGPLSSSMRSVSSIR